MTVYNLMELSTDHIQSSDFDLMRSLNRTNEYTAPSSFGWYPEGAFVSIPKEFEAQDYYNEGFSPSLVNILSNFSRAGIYVVRFDCDAKEHGNYPFVSGDEFDPTIMLSTECEKLWTRNIECIAKDEGAKVFEFGFRFMDGAYLNVTVQGSAEVPMVIYELVDGDEVETGEEPFSGNIFQTYSFQEREIKVVRESDLEE